MQTLQANDQTRNTVIAAYQDSTTPIGWAVNGDGSGIIYNPSLSGSPKLFASGNVVSTLTSISPNAILVRGNSGISITSGILQSTFAGMLSDDYVAAQLLKGVTFIGDIVIQG